MKCGKFPFDLIVQFSVSHKVTIKNNFNNNGTRKCRSLNHNRGKIKCITFQTAFYVSTDNAVVITN